MKFLLPLAAFVLLAVVLAVGIVHAPQKGLIASPLLHKPAPAFSLPSLLQPSQQVSTADFRGHWYLLNVWGTWCAGCREEHPLLLKAKASGVLTLVGLDWKDDAQQAQAFLAQAGNPYQAIAVDRSGRTAIDYGVYGAPESFLIDPAGVVVYKQVGELTEEAWTREILPRISARP